MGAEIMAGMGEEVDEEAIPLVEKSVFAGTGAQVTRDVDVSVGELRGMLRDRHWRAALPALLAIGGLFGLVVFGVLALWVKMDDKRIATPIAAVVLLTMGRIGWSFLRACGQKPGSSAGPVSLQLAVGAATRYQCSDGALRGLTH
jgi:hypothetical protein